MTKVCRHCHALVYKSESKGFCCRNGKVNLPAANDPPEDLLRLYQTDPNFRTNIRAYNQIFAFTSMGVNVDNNLANGRDGVFTFRINGSICHRIGDYSAKEEGAKYAQIYMLDEEEQLRRRRGIFSNLDEDTTTIINRVLNAVNPYSHVR